jgi:DNA adenine methylase
VRWPGGKSWLAPRLRPIWHRHSHRRLVEVFAGGIGLSLGLRPKRALLNDLNSHLINLYRQVKGGLALTMPPDSKDVFQDALTRLNALIEAGRSDTEEAAQLFFVVVTLCYGGHIRPGIGGRISASFGYRGNKIKRSIQTEMYWHAFQGWEFTSVDFESVPIDPEDFVFADPPYDGRALDYFIKQFDWDEQVRLALWLAKHPGPVVITNYPTDRLLSLYRDLGYHLAIERRINSLKMQLTQSDEHKRSLELIAWRNLGDNVESVLMGKGARDDRQRTLFAREASAEMDGRQGVACSGPAAGTHTVDSLSRFAEVCPWRSALCRGGPSSTTSTRT